MRRMLAVLVLAVVLFASSTAVAQVNLTFDKQAVADGIWIGTVGGDVTGRLVTVLLSADQSQPVWQMELYWVIVADDPSQSFVARLTGTFDTEAGTVAMEGDVDEGFQSGAAVVEAGELQDAETMRFTGTIQLTPSTAAAQAEDDSIYPWEYANGRSPARVSLSLAPAGVPTCDDPHPMGHYPWDELPDCS